MKKFLSILMVLALCLSLVPAALATETESIITWEEVAPLIEEEGWEGDFVELPDVELKLWVPVGLLPVELNEEALEIGYIAYFMSEDESVALGVTLTDAGMTEEDLLTTLADMGVEDAGYTMINGVNFITYTNVLESGVVCNVASLVNENGYVLEFAFTAGDEGYEALSLIILSSIQGAD